MRLGKSALPHATLPHKGYMNSNCRRWPRDDPQRSRLLEFTPQGLPFPQVWAGLADLPLRKRTRKCWPVCLRLGYKRLASRDFPDGPVIKHPPANAGDTGSIPGPGRSHMPWGD